MIMTVCEAFDQTVSEAEAEIICLRAWGIPNDVSIFSVEAAGKVYKKYHNSVYIRGTSTTMPAYPSKSAGAYSTHSAALGIFSSLLIIHTGVNVYLLKADYSCFLFCSGADIVLVGGYS